MTTPKYKWQTDYQALIDRVNELSDRHVLGELNAEEVMEYELSRISLQKITNYDLQAKQKEKEAKSREMKNRIARGKYAEKKVAKDVGGRADGRAGKKDVVQGMFHYEVKSHKRVPKYLQDIMNEAVRLAGKGKIPVGVVFDRNNRQYYYILLKNDWVGLHGR